jgi:hypothetical protein
MWVAQNASIAGANLVAGWLYDSAGASALNPADDGLCGMKPWLMLAKGVQMAVPQRAPGSPYEAVLALHDPVNSFSMRSNLSSVVTSQGIVHERHA